MRDGILHQQPHANTLEYPRTNPVTNIFADVDTYCSSAVKRIEEIQPHIFKVDIGGSMYCMKSVHRTGRKEDFVREVSVLR